MVKTKQKERRNWRDAKESEVERRKKGHRFRSQAGGKAPRGETAWRGGRYERREIRL